MSTIRTMYKERFELSSLLRQGEDFLLEIHNHSRHTLTLFGLGDGGGGQNGPLRVFAKYLKNGLSNLHENL